MEDRKIKNVLIEGGMDAEDEEEWGLSLNDLYEEAVLNIITDAFSKYVDERREGVLKPSPLNANFRLMLVKKFRDDLLPKRFHGALQREKKILTRISKMKSLSLYKHQQSSLIRAIEDLLKSIPAAAWEISQDLIKGDYVSKISFIERVLLSDNLIGMMLPAVISNIYLNEAKSRKVLFSIFEKEEPLGPGDMTLKFFGSNENVVISVLSVIVIVVGLTSCLSVIGVNYDDPEPISGLLDEFIETEPELFAEIISILNEKNIFAESKDFYAYRIRLKTLDVLPIEHKKLYLIDQYLNHGEKEQTLFGGLKASDELQDKEAEERKKIIANNEKKSKLQQESIQKLKQEVDRLSNELKSSKSADSQGYTSTTPLQNENRQLQNQITKLKAESESYRAELSNIKKFTQLILDNENIKEPVREVSEGLKVSIGEIQKHVAFIGGHENLHMKLRKSFPKALYLSPDKLNFTTDAFDNIKYCLYFTEYCNHSLFEKVSVEIKKRGIKSTFCPYNNVDKVLEALNELVQFI